MNQQGSIGTSVRQEQIHCAAADFNNSERVVQVILDEELLMEPSDELTPALNPAKPVLKVNKLAKTYFVIPGPSSCEPTREIFLFLLEETFFFG